MKPHEPKNMDKTRAEKKGKPRAIKNQIKKRRKGNKTLSQKNEKGRKKNFDKKAIKKKELKVQAHELLASTLCYLMLAHW
jgi:hypothetical protein